MMERLHSVFAARFGCHSVFAAKFGCHSSSRSNWMSEATSTIMSSLLCSSNLVRMIDACESYAKFKRNQAMILIGDADGPAQVGHRNGRCRYHRRRHRICKNITIDITSSRLCSHVQFRILESLVPGCLLVRFKLTTTNQVRLIPHDR